MPTAALSAGNWIKVKQIGALETVTFTGTMDGATGFYIANQYDAYEFIYSGSGSGWDIN
jgi:hypothetical protein